MKRVGGDGLSGSDHQALFGRLEEAKLRGMVTAMMRASTLQRQVQCEPGALFLIILARTEVGRCHRCISRDDHQAELAALSEPLTYEVVHGQ